MNENTLSLVFFGGGGGGGGGVGGYLECSFEI